MTETNKTIIGITGYMGSGKTYICNILSEWFGIPIYSCDLSAKRILDSGPFSLKHEIMKEIGIDSYTSEGKYNAEWIKKEVIKDDKILGKIQKILRPYLLKDLDSFIEKENNNVIGVESAIFPKELQEKMDLFIFVAAKKEIRIQRILQRDPNRSKEEIEILLGNQSFSDLKNNKNFHVVENSNEDFKSLSERLMEIIKTTNWKK